MIEGKTITLGGNQFEVSIPPFGVMKKIVSSLSRVSQTVGDMDVYQNEAAISVGLLIGKTPAEMDQMTFTHFELVAAFNLVPEVCGLVRRGDEAGEAQPGSL